MKPLKRIERYFSALFTLGRVKGMAKDAHRSLPRVDHMETQVTEMDARLGGVQGDLNAMQASLDARQSHLEDVDGRMHRAFQWMDRHENMAGELVADYRREAEILRRTGQSDTALLARMFTDLSRRLDGQGSTPPDAAPAKTDSAQHRWF